MKKPQNSKLSGVSCIYSDLAVRILSKFCEVQCPRASYVETVLDLPESTIKRLKEMGKPLDLSLWYVDFSPVDDDTILGPFTCREDALRSEVEYLNKKIKESNHD